VGMGENDSAKPAAKLADNAENGVLGPGKTRIHQGETLSFANEVTIDETPTGELVSIGGNRGNSHMIKFDAVNPLRFCS
jgi:hypothetical protein